MWKSHDPTSLNVIIILLPIICEEGSMPERERGRERVRERVRKRVRERVRERGQEKEKRERD